MVKDVVLLSGGLDSTTVLAIARDELDKARKGHGPGEEIATVNISYGQRHKMEIAAAKSVSAYYLTRHIEDEMEIPKGDSVLMNHQMEMPQMTYEEIEQSEGVSPTYVPFRNAQLISRAVAHALDLGAERVWVGVHAEDARGWAYPDCTPEFIGAMQNAVWVGTYHKIRLIAPLQYLMKHEIVRKGKALSAPFELTWSCYEDGMRQCGKCPTCVARQEAFRIAGYNDPGAYLVA